MAATTLSWGERGERAEGGGEGGVEGEGREGRGGGEGREGWRGKEVNLLLPSKECTHLYVHLELKQVHIHPVAAVQSQVMPGLGRERAMNHTPTYSQSDNW